MFIDVHTHAHFAAFATDWREVIDRAMSDGVRVVNVGTQMTTSRRAVEVAREYESGVYATVGLHPLHTSRSYHDEKELGGGATARAFVSRGEEFDGEYYAELSRDPKVVAIGECGLDYYRLSEETDRQEKIRQQKDAFLRQIELAIRVGKPLMIHCRRAAGDLIDILRPYASVLRPGIAHFFTDGTAYARQLLDLNFSFSIGGVVTFTREYDEMIKILPLRSILSETDAPYVAPVPYRGQRNEPAYVVETVKKLAELKGLTVEKMAAQIFENAQRVLGIKDS